MVATGPSDLWMTAWSRGPNGYNRFAYHWDGTSWIRVDRPAPDPCAGTDGSCTADTQPSDGVEDEPSDGVEPSDTGGTAALVDDPAPAGYPGLTGGVAATGNDNVWLWGTTADGAAIAHYDGHTWTAGPRLPGPPGSLSISQVAPLGRDCVLVAGTHQISEPSGDRAEAVVLAWQHGRWQTVSLPRNVTAADTAQITLASAPDRRTILLLVNTVAGSVRQPGFCGGRFIPRVRGCGG